MRTRVALATFAVLVYGATAYFAVVGWPAAFCGALTLVIVLDEWLARAGPSIFPSFTATRLLGEIRLLALIGWTDILAAQTLHLLAETLAVVGSTLFVYAARSVYLRVDEAAGALRDLPVGWRNLAIAGMPPPGAPWRSLAGVRASKPLLALLALSGSIWAADVGGASISIFTAAALTFLVAVVSVVVLLLHLRLLKRRFDPDEVRGRVLEAVIAYAPEVVIYSGGNDPTMATVETWLPSIRRLSRRVLVMVRDVRHLDSPQIGDLPTLFLPGASDVESFAVPSIQLALYPTKLAKNNHLIRVPGILDVFVGLGYGDDPDSAVPELRIFDEVWVAGPLARRRLLLSGIGLEDAQVREVGRPQLIEWATAARSSARDPRLTALYVPIIDGPNVPSLSSLPRLGEDIMKRLAGMDSMRVLYRPHPVSGIPDPECVAAESRLPGVVGKPLLEPPVTLFDSVDLLIGDVSDTMTDFLVTGKPYLLTNPGREDPRSLCRDYPVACSASILSSDVSDLEALVTEAVDSDRKAKERARIAREILGSSDADPLERLERAITEAIGRQEERHESRR